MLHCSMHTVIFYRHSFGRTLLPVTDSTMCIRCGITKRPQSLFFFMVPESAFNGNYKETPFHHTHHYLKSYRARFRDECYPSSPATVNFGPQKPKVLEMYREYLKCTGWVKGFIWHFPSISFVILQLNQASNGMTLTRFELENCIGAIALSPEEMVSNSQPFTSKETGELLLELDFYLPNPPVPARNNLLIYVFGILPSTVKIDKNREVTIEN